MARRAALLSVDPDTPWASLPADMKRFILDKVTEMEDDVEKLVQDHQKLDEKLEAAVQARDWESTGQLSEKQHQLRRKLSDGYGVHYPYLTEKGDYVRRVKERIAQVKTKEESRKRNVRKVLTGKIKKATR